jgi:hypothetical protein
MPPANLFSERPHRKASGARSLLTKFLFVAVISAIAMLLCYEISVAFRLPQLDPRVLFRHLRSG